MKKISDKQKKEKRLLSIVYNQLSEERTKLLDYCKNMEYILEVDTEYYFLITE